MTLNSFTASDRVLVVVSPGYFELDSLVQLGKTLEEVREYFNPTLELLGYLFTMSEPTINAATSLQILRQRPTPNRCSKPSSPATPICGMPISIRLIFTPSTPVPKQPLPMTSSSGSWFLPDGAPVEADTHIHGKSALNIDIVSNELRGSSAFFPRSQDELAPVRKPAPETSVQDPPSTAHPVPPVRVVPPVPLVRAVPPPKRVMKQRWPVDIYQDQYESLQALALEERKQGGIGSMSAMVREALDKLIAERKHSKK